MFVRLGGEQPGKVPLWVPKSGVCDPLVTSLQCCPFPLLGEGGHGSVGLATLHSVHGKG